MGIVDKIKQLLGAGRLFRSNYNRNQANSIRHARRHLAPYSYILASIFGVISIGGGAIGLLVWMAITYVTLFMNPKDGALSGTVLGVIGIGLASAILSLLTAIGAGVGAARWYRS